VPDCYDFVTKRPYTKNYPNIFGLISIADIFSGLYANIKNGFEVKKEING
jgi:hypothetical protein